MFSRKTNKVNLLNDIVLKTIGSVADKQGHRLPLKKRISLIYGILNGLKRNNKYSFFYSPFLFSLVKVRTNKMKNTLKSFSSKFKRSSILSRRTKSENTSCKDTILGTNMRSAGSLKNSKLKLNSKYWKTKESRYINLQEAFKREYYFRNKAKEFFQFLEFLIRFGFLTDGSLSNVKDSAYRVMDIWEVFISFKQLYTLVSSLQYFEGPAIIFYVKNPEIEQILRNIVKRQKLHNFIEVLRNFKKVQRNPKASQLLVYLGSFKETFLKLAAERGFCMISCVSTDESVISKFPLNTYLVKQDVYRVDKLQVFVSMIVSIIETAVKDQILNLKEAIFLRNKNEEWWDRQEHSVQNFDTIKFSTNLSIFENNELDLLDEESIEDSEKDLLKFDNNFKEIDSDEETIIIKEFLIPETANKNKSNKAKKNKNKNLDKPIIDKAFQKDLVKISRINRNRKGKPINNN